jgi:hypothetical protein
MLAPFSIGQESGAPHLAFEMWVQGGLHSCIYLPNAQGSRDNHGHKYD